MKEQENIKNINSLSMSYMMLSGLKGVSLDNDNPFLLYLTYNMLTNEKNKEGNKDKFIYVIDNVNGFESSSNKIPNFIVHALIKESHNMYKDLCNINPKKFGNNIMVEKILDNDYDSFVDSLVDRYISTLLSILTNYNSNNEEYNSIKIDIYTNELNKSVLIEDYDKSIFYRDKIKYIKERMLNNKKTTEI